MPTPHRPPIPNDHTPTDEKREESRLFADVIATLLDTAFTIPGTRIRIGLDPLIGLIPGVGDYLTSLIGSSLLFFAARAGVPRIVMCRMALNILINMIVGALPGIGDVFSVWFKSNTRNADLLREHAQAGPPASTATDWVYVIGLALIMLVTLTFLLWGMLALLAALWGLLTTTASSS